MNSLNQNNPVMERPAKRQASKAVSLGKRVMNYARDSILVNMRFLDVAISALELQAVEGTGGFASNGAKIYFDPVFLLKKYI